MQGNALCVVAPIIMRQSRIYTTQHLHTGKRIELEARASHYLANVLRTAVAETLVLFNGDGNEYLAEVLQVNRQKVVVRLLQVTACTTESPLHITLAQAVSKGERMDYCVQKAAELGVDVIQPLLTRRVVVRMDQKRQLKRLAHWQAVAVSACEQSGRARVPAILQPLTLDQWLGTAAIGERLVLAPEAQQKLSQFQPKGSSVSLLVGPEGGFEDQEVADAIAAGCQALSMGPRILRTETAGPVAIALLQASSGDL